eukprot:scaffold83948_cov63-Attheya_sp.AAC.3
MGIRIDASGSLVTGDSGSSSLCSSGRTFDVFGFNLDWKSLLIVMMLVAVMLGPSGLVAFFFAWGAYTAFMRYTGDSGSGGGNSSRGRGAWSNGRAGANIKGVKDLPPPPSGG